MDKTSAYRSLLSNPQLLYAYMSGSFPTIKLINRYTYNELHMQSHNLPDYALKKGRDKTFSKEENLSSYLTRAFRKLSDHFLYSRANKIYVYPEEFHNWQNFITTVTPLPIICSHLHKQLYENTIIHDNDKIIDTITNLIGKTSYPSIFSEHLNQLIEDEGLNERHLHINGSVETDSVWLKALKCPKLFYKELMVGFKKEVVKEQYLQIGHNITPKTMYNLIRCCRELRSIMVDILFKYKKTDFKMPNEHDIIHSLRSCTSLYDHLNVSVTFHHPIVKYIPAFSNKNLRVLEAFFYIKALNFIEFIQIPLFSIMFHIYIIVLNQINTLLVQQRDCFGFDQFQKVTMNDCRGQSEKSFVDRFMQFEGMYGEDLSSLEARFAPKHNYSDNRNRLIPIIKDFEKYKNSKKICSLTPYIDKSEEKRMDLRLICHFIKDKDEIRNKEESLFILGRHRKLRIENRKAIYSLLLLARKNKKVRDYLGGFDAASNELHTPPEVYAPIYRLLRYNGFENFTYHAGEDFIHLVSGIRAVYEARKFLGLKAGNRIGHGTALGIDPELWKKRALKKTVIEQGEWLDNLVFAWSLLSDIDTDFNYILPKIQAKIEKYTYDIYKEHYPIYTVIDAWKLRDIDTLIAFSNREYLNPFFQKEKRYIKRKIDDNRDAWNIFKMYHSREGIEEYRKEIYIDEDLFLDHIDILYALQKSVIKKLNKEEVAIETLPTSNVRISYYHDYSEHHLPKWIGSENHDEDFLLPTVLVGTDDPGIFATNLRNEYAHIFLLLTKKCGLSNDQAYFELKRLNRNGKMYGF